MQRNPVDAGGGLRISQDRAHRIAADVLTAAGCLPAGAASVAEHLVDASLRNVASHGIWRLGQYIDQIERGYLIAGAEPRRVTNPQGAVEIDGRGGLGIPAMALATTHLIEAAKAAGIAAIAVRRVGHTGRVGAFAERGAEAGLLTIVIGGGGRQTWRQVAPFGGRRGLLPTNPYSIAMPGGARGPVVVDFATAAIAGGWIYEAERAGRRLPEGAIIDAEGRPSTDPSAYFDGGAILPAGGAKGYGLAVAAEMIGEAMLGPSTTECHWLMVGIDTARYRGADALRDSAEAVLAELRDCPPAEGFDRVEVPGERERDALEVNRRLGLPVAPRVWEGIEAVAARYGVATE